MFGIDDAIAAAGSIGSSALSFLGNKSMQEDAQGFSKEMMQKKYQWMVDDLKKAGLNPVYAVGGASAGMASSPALPSGAGNVGLTSSQIQLARAQADLAASSAAKARSETLSPGIADRAALASAGAAEASGRHSDAMVNEIAEQIKKITDERSNLAADFAIKQIELKLKGMERDKLAAIIPDLIQLVSNEAYRSKLGLTAVENMSAVEKSAWGEVAAYLRSVFGNAPASGAAAIFNAIK